MTYDGPLPQWTPLDHRGPWEATAPDGVMWRLWYVGEPTPDDPFPASYRLAPRDAPDGFGWSHISADHGLYNALDAAGMRIAGDAIRADLAGARRQLGLEDC